MNRIKRLLAAAGLLEFARTTRSFVKGLSPALLASELRLRLRGAPDGFPLPPADLLFTVIATRWASTFLDSGARIVGAMERELEYAGRPLSNFDTILDFGCGCGRLTRQLPARTNAKLFGCDYNPRLVRWSSEHLSFADFKINFLDPPLPYPDASFDFVFARSVFTHLPEAGQIAWIEELRRVLKPDGVLYFTTHGRQFFDQLSKSEAETVLKGGLAVHLAEEAGRNICSSFALPEYVSRHLLQGFTLLRFVPGTREDHLRQDSYIVSKDPA